MPGPSRPVLSWMTVLPSCPKCRNRMSLAHLQFYDKGKDKWNYEGHRCGHEVSEVTTFK
jgi:hypothetical protein